ncbi:hypothetical protein STEG23_014717 [Scotinomys teguina]
MGGWRTVEELVEQEGVTVKGSSHFNPDPDAETLYKAMKGIGTNEQAIIDVLTKRSNVQRQQIAKSFKAQFGKDLTETLKSELSGKFERLIVALMYPPYKYEAKELHDAMKGLGTKEGVIIEILASRTKNQLREIMKAYEEDYGSSLEEDIQGDTSGYLERILVCLLQGSRDDVSGFVDPGLALQDAQDLYAAGEKIHGTDEMKFITILCTRSATHLMRVFEEYEKIANKSIEDSIKSENHGSLEEAMLTVVKCTRNLHSYFAERLYYAMKGAGTRDGTLIRNIVSRSEIDLNLIKCQFQKMYGKTLSSMIMCFSPNASYPEGSQGTASTCTTTKGESFFVSWYSHMYKRSGSMAGNWKNIYLFTENLVKKFQSPKLRMSFITYSTDADILLPLTSDREEIHRGLLRLQKLVPEGRAFMHKGFMKANKSRRMGATVYTVGVHECDKQQDIIDPVSKWDVEDWGDPVCIPRGLLDPVSKWDVEDWGDPVCIPRGLLDPGEEDPIWVPRRLTRILKDASMDDDVPDEPADALDEPTAGEDGAKMGDPVSVSEFDASPA